MKRYVSIFSCCLFLLLAATDPARAQDGVELERFQQAAGDRSILFRGKQAVRYLFPANGNPYWENADFKNGDILCEGRLYRDVPINIDANRQTVLVQLSSGMLAVALSPAQAPSFTRDGRQFVGISADGPLPEGFYEVFGAGPEQVYKYVEKRLNSTTGNMNGDPIGYYDPDYRTEVTRYFAIRTLYFFRDDQGGFSRIRGKNALIRKFPGRRKEIREGLRNARLDEPGSSFDSICEAILKLTAR